MSQVDILRNTIIDKILVIKDLSFLKALAQNLKLQSTDSIVRFSESQKKLIHAGLKDLEKGNSKTQAQIDRVDLKWLEEL